MSEETPHKMVDGVLVPLEGAELADYEARLNTPVVRPPRIILAGWVKAAISKLGHKAAVEAAVAQQPEWKRELWSAATHVRENDADVVAIANALNINLSEVFDEADRIRIATRGGA